MANTPTSALHAFGMDARLYRDMGRLEDHHWWFRGRRAVLRDVLQARLPIVGHRRILDVGCGTGGMLPMLSEFGDVEGLEGSLEGVEQSRARMGERASIHHGWLPDGIPVGARYDLVTAFDVLEHLDDPVAALANIRAALASVGLFACTVPAWPFLWSRHDELNHHRRRYTRTTLREHLTEGGFVVRHLSCFNVALFPAVAAVRLAHRVFKLPRGGSAGSDLAEIPGPLNTLLEGIFSAERFFVPWLRLPVGVSLLAIAAPA